MKKRFTVHDLQRIGSFGICNTPQNQDWLTAEIAAEIQLVERFMADHTSPATQPGYTKAPGSSYTLKHIVEHAFGTYISNSAAIIGMFNSRTAQYYFLNEEKAHTSPNTEGRFYISLLALENYRSDKRGYYGTSGKASEVVKQLQQLDDLKASFKNRG